MKLTAVVEAYFRNDAPYIRNITINGNNEMDLLMDFVDRIGCYLSVDDIKEEGMTFDEVLERLEESNGDGCDFIMKLNINGKDLIDMDVYDEEEYKVGE